MLREWRLLLYSRSFFAYLSPLSKNIGPTQRGEEGRNEWMPAAAQSALPWFLFLCLTSRNRKPRRKPAGDEHELSGKKWIEIIPGSMPWLPMSGKIELRLVKVSSQQTSNQSQVNNKELREPWSSFSLFLSLSRASLHRERIFCLETEIGTQR